MQLHDLAFESYWQLEHLDIIPSIAIYYNLVLFSNSTSSKTASEMYNVVIFIYMLLWKKSFSLIILS